MYICMHSCMHEYLYVSLQIYSNVTRNMRGKERMRHRSRRNATIGYGRHVAHARMDAVTIDDASMHVTASICKCAYAY